MTAYLYEYQMFLLYHAPEENLSKVTGTDVMTQEAEMHTGLYKAKLNDDLIVACRPER